MGRATAHFFGPAPWGPGERPKGQLSLNIIKFQLQSNKVAKSISKFFQPNFVCLLTRIRQDFHLAAWVMPQGWDLGVPRGFWGRQKNFLHKFNQIWCGSYLHEWHMHRRHFLGPRPLGPSGGAKKSIIIKSELQSQFQIFKRNFVYLFTNERYIKYQMGLLFGRLGHAQGWDLGVPWWVGGKQKNFRNSTRFDV